MPLHLVKGTTAAQNPICAAIHARLRLEFEYNGSLRLVEPYCHGFTRNGEALRAVQRPRAHESGGAGFGFGKLWMVARMRSVRVTGEHFTADDPAYNPNDSAMLRIHCRI